MNKILVQAFDIIPIILTIFGNIVCLLTLLKTRSLHNPANVFLGALCISDLFVGFIVQPLFIININAQMQGDFRFAPFEYRAILIGAGCSFMIATMVSVDRYIAICHPFYYLRVSNCKTNFIIVGVTSAVLSAMCIIMVSLSIERYLFVILVIAAILVYLTVISTYCMIYRVVYKQRKVAVTIGEIQGSTRQQTCKMHKERSRTFAIALLLLVLLLCYAPSLVFLVFDFVHDFSYQLPATMIIFSLWTRFISLLSSCFNPMIYSLRCTDVRKAVFQLLKINREANEQSEV